MIKCNLCEKVFKSDRGIRSHVGKMHCGKKQVAWNKGLTKETSQRVAKSGRTLSSVKQEARLERIREKQLIIHFCKNCNSEHNGSYGSSKFCCIRCYKIFASKAKRQEINQKLSLKLKKPAIINICGFCKNTYERLRKNRNIKTCSKSCSSKLAWTNQEYRKSVSEKASKNAKIRHTTNENFGWQTRSKFEPSYPETIAIRALDELNISYEREVKFGKYFVDFIIHHAKIVIEIDGSQHNKQERITSDSKKDTLLNELGLSVVRIKYPQENIIQRINEICKHLI